MAVAAPRVVVVGGGIGGVAVVRALRRCLPKARLTLVERRREYFFAPLSAFALTGAAGWTVAGRRFGYAALARETGVEVVRARAEAVAAEGVTLADGRRLACECAVAAVGAGFAWGGVPGAEEAVAAAHAPHAYDGDVRQYAALRRRLAAMPDDGVFMLIAPPAPYACAPAPYDRAGMVAAWMAREKPRGRVLILDQKESFAQQTLFGEYWGGYYGGRVEWLSADGGGRVLGLDAPAGVAVTEFGEEAAAVINYIPPQRAADVALESGLVDDSGWCPVRLPSMESELRDGVFVVGDAARLPGVPKAGSSAASAARLAAAAIGRRLGGGDGGSGGEGRVAFVCFSYVAPEAAFVERGEYAVGGGEVVARSHFLTRRGAGAAALRAVAAEGVAWQREAAEGWFGGRGLGGDVGRESV